MKGTEETIISEQIELGMKMEASYYKSIEYSLWIKDFLYSLLGVPVVEVKDDTFISIFINFGSIGIIPSATCIRMIKEVKISRK